MGELNLYHRTDGSKSSCSSSGHEGRFWGCKGSKIDENNGSWYLSLHETAIWFHDKEDDHALLEACTLQNLFLVKPLIDKLQTANRSFQEQSCILSLLAQELPGWSIKNGQTDGIDTFYYYCLYSNIDFVNSTCHFCCVHTVHIQP